MTDLPLDFVTSRPVGRSLWRGFKCRRPACGDGKLYRAYLKVVDRCEACGTDLTPQRADDAPAYMTIFIVGHIIVSGVMATEFVAPDTPFWVPALVWSAIAAGASLLLLPRVKGALVGLQWANRMHGFGGVAD
jgi:uncharacterized protein (DUF983 family)